MHNIVKALELLSKNLFWCQKEESNPQPTDYDSVALPIELFWRGCPDRIRTYACWSQSPEPYRLATGQYN